MNQTVIKSLTIIFIVLFSILPVYANEEESTEIEPIVISATGTPVSLDNVGGSSVTVITTQELEEKNITHVSDLLKQIPGVDIARNGGPGSNTSLFMRGSDSNQILVLIDGVIQNDPSQVGRSADIANIPLENIERVEVIKGSQSVLYGTDATAGVINIITKQGEGKFKFTLGTELASFNTQKSYTGYSGSEGVFSYSLTISSFQTDGFSIEDTDNDEIKHNYDDKDRYAYQMLSLNLGYQINENFNLKITGYQMDSVTDLDFSSNVRVDKKIQSHTVQVHNLFLDGNFESTLSYKQRSNKRSYFKSLGLSNYYRGKNKEVSWQGSFYSGEVNTLTFGTSKVEEFSEDTYADEQSANTTSVWLQNQTFLLDESLNLVIGARNDNHEEFGTATTWRVAPSFELIESKTKFKASLGTGFRAPSLYQLYNPTYGNKALEAEKSTTWDFGVEQKFGKKNFLSLTWFNNEFSKKIDFDFATFRYKQDEEGKTKTEGAEVIFKTEPAENMSFQVQYTYTETEDPDEKRLPRVPMHKYQVNSLFKLSEKTTMRLNAGWVGERVANDYAKDKDGNKVFKLESYTLLNFAINHNLENGSKIYGRIDNLTDQYYEECWGYATPNRSFTIGAKMVFQ